MICGLLLTAAALGSAVTVTPGLEVKPTLLVLGEEPSRATLFITAAQKPQLSASVGRIENLRPSGPSSWLADYLPPEETIPRVALIAALDGAELSWIALPLWGQGDAIVQTRRHARISVDIGSRSFGPVEADANGEAVVPVVVPPGVREARQKGRAIDLHVPATQLVHAVLLQASARADQASAIEVRVLAVSAEGQPRSGAQLLFRATRGTVGEVHERAPGELSAVWTLPPGAATIAHLEVALKEAPRLFATLALALEAGPAASLELSADRAQLVAGEPAPLVLRVVGRDAAGNLSPEPLEIESAARVGDHFELRAPEQLVGRALEVVAHPRGRAQPHASLLVKLLPAAAAAVVLDPPAAWVETGSRLQLRARRIDRFGNAVPAQAAPVVFTAEGSLVAVRAQADGAWLATYLPPKRWTRPETEVEVRWGPSAARSRISILPRDTLFALSPKLGLLSNFARLTSPLAAIEASLRSDRFGPELGLAAEVSWAFATRNDAAGGGVVHLKDDFFALSTQLSLRRRVGIRALLFVGAGPSLTLAQNHLGFGNNPWLTERALVAGALVSTGMELRFPRLIPFAELRWSWHADPHFATVSGAQGAFSLALGSRFELH